MKGNTVDEVTRKEEKKRVRSLRKSASDLSLTGPPSIGGWLECLGLKQYESHFIREGFSDIESVRFVVLSYAFY
jgi:SAM domain (Sterile alpha motif)